MIPQVATRTSEWVDTRLGLGKWTRKALDKIFPDHWSFMFGEIALYSFIVVVATGVYLTLFFVPSLKHIIYHGSYVPLQGQRVSEAYNSTINISFDVRFGMVMRQMHHWAADVFLAAIALHMCRIFFTGAFRRPRELNWIVGVTLLVLAIVNGYIGYSLPDDLISGTGVRIAFSIILAIPVVGSYFATFFFGGNFPGEAYDFRFFIVHVLIIPGIIIGLLVAHLAIMWHQKHTQFKGHGATNDNVVGSALWPAYTLKTTGFFFVTSGALAALGGLAQINPIWLYGPYDPFKVTYAVQPDWYMGWLDGALRIFPSWEPSAFGHMISTVFFPAILLPGITFGLFWAWPFIENHFTRESTRDHNLLDRPRERPLRTTIGAGVLAFYVMLFTASATDVLANFFGVSLNLVLWAMRFMTVLVPLVVAGATYIICQETISLPDVGKRKRPSVIVRSAGGGYESLETDFRPGDEPKKLEPEELPGAYVHDKEELVGSVQQLRGYGGGSGGDGSDGDGSGDGRSNGGGGGGQPAAAISPEGSSVEGLGHEGPLPGGGTAS